MEIIKYRQNKNSPWVDIPAIVGPQGPQGIQGEKGEQGIQGEPGAQGPKGDAYTLTEDDKTDIAALVLAQLPSTEEVEY